MITVLMQDSTVKEFVVPSLDENMESNYMYRDFNQLEDGVPKKVFTTRGFYERT